MCKCTTQILQEAENLFNKYKDGNNVITKESLVKVMDKVVDARAKAIMKKADTDNNKEISKKGMLSHCTTQLTQNEVVQGLSLSLFIASTELEKLLKVKQDAAWFTKMVDVLGKN